MSRRPGNQDRAVEITAWLRRHYPRWQGGPTEAASGLAWIRWLLAGNSMGIVRLRGQIVGVGAVRRLSDPADWHRPYVDVPGAGWAWVDFVVCRHPAALKTLWEMMLQRCPGCAWLGGAKDKAGGRVRWMPVARMTRLLRGMDTRGETGGPYGQCPHR